MPTSTMWAHKGISGWSSIPCYTANVLDAETATISCVTFPVALQMHFVQLLAAANF